MSNLFKVGDIVERTGPDFAQVKRGGIYKVTAVDSVGVNLEDINGRDMGLCKYDPSYFQLTTHSGQPTPVPPPTPQAVKYSIGDKVIRTSGNSMVLQIGHVDTVKAVSALGDIELASIPGLFWSAKYFALAPAPTVGQLVIPDIYEASRVRVTSSYQIPKACKCGYPNEYGHAANQGSEWVCTECKLRTQKWA